MSAAKPTPEQVRTDFVPRDAYISKEYVQLEKQHLWPNAWLMACRLEEIPNVGDYVTFDIADESIIVTRLTGDKLKAYYNVCQHRGRRLTKGCGHATKFHCNFHGWQWNLDGSVLRILDEEDWAGCPSMSREDMALKEVQIDTWGGFVFINMNPEAEPLAKYLAPVPEITDCYEFEKMRFRWYKSVRLPCNWKVALEAFNEGYHVAATHPQVLESQGDDVTRSFSFGRHGMFGYPTATRLPGTPSPRTGKPIPDDIRPGMINFYQIMEDQLKAIFTDRDLEATKRLMTELEPTDDQLAVFGKTLQLQAEAAIADGAGWPNISPEQMMRAGTDWHVFPNMVFLMYPDGALFYRARPDGDNPDSCFYDIMSIKRYAPGTEPKVEREVYHGIDDWKTNQVDSFGLILTQDFNNMGEVQLGMKSRGFAGARTNPLQESSISNFHRELHEVLKSGQES